MSYSFQVVIQTKAEAEAKIAEEFDKIVATQPVHAQDRTAALATALAFVNLLADEPNKAIQVNVTGWVSWQHPGGAFDESAVPIHGAAVSASASLVEAQT
ncbi:hypothetical protein U0F71_06635 [Burkholderia pseudomallei]|uniref:hypothetical protein n=1 Tax=Burkholderia pseudomallei TaxID=28450 RepID=UPI002AB3CD54|nr:hypothetical protein [Burkholderia pseudomallei]MDY7815390.1 hypothetical protein [Burkholderia pseudomallei]MDY7862049.1 hypothetical protein [Burkholderia pseudomallei]